jgi:uncharacterized phiE125 gp8 family phage protein
MSTIVITPPSVEPVTLAEAKLQTRASTADEAFLALCIEGARAHCEGLIQQAIIRRTVEQFWDTFPEQEIQLSARPAVSIESVKYTDTQGAEATLAASAYTLDNRDIDQWLLPAVGAQWPQTEATVNAVRVRYVVGLAATAADVPPAIRTWLLLTIGTLFMQRESFAAGAALAEIPGRFVDSLLDPFRVYGF